MMGVIPLATSAAAGFSEGKLPALARRPRSTSMLDWVLKSMFGPISPKRGIIVRSSNVHHLPPKKHKPHPPLHQSPHDCINTVYENLRTMH